MQTFASYDVLVQDGDLIQQKHGTETGKKHECGRDGDGNDGVAKEMRESKPAHVIKKKRVNEVYSETPFADKPDAFLP